MDVKSGSRLGPYEIGARLGAGGMGEVYRARDTRLDRSVAIKVLPAKLANDAQLKARLEREAKAISQLNHPNICTLYDVGDGYLVMELLEGESLADRLARGPLPMADVLRFGAQIAEALDRAHRSGIVHRDLKPGNIMLTKSGAKLLDFGLAKAGVMTFGSNDVTQQQQPLTAEGTILGTFIYMAPEQLEGLEADARTDIFALGAVLYEMATGQRAFQGATRTSLIAAIVGSVPKPLGELVPVAPPLLEHVVQKCLEKDPDERWQSAHDISTELRWIAERTAAQETTAPARRAMAPWLLGAALVLTIVAVIAAVSWGMRSPAAQPTAFSIIPPSGIFGAYARVSPDGQAIVFGSPSRSDGESVLWIRDISDLTLHPVPNTERATQPFWSPDGQSIAFFQDGKLKAVDLAGGKPREISNGDYSLGGMWTSEGTIVFCPAWGSGLLQVPAAGGTAKPLTQLDASLRESVHGWPVQIAGTRTILFLNRRVPGESHVAAVSLGGGKPKTIVEADSLVGYSEPFLLYVRDEVVYAHEMDARSLAMRGEARAVADGASFTSGFAHSGGSTGGETLAYYALHRRPSVIEWIDRDGKRETVIDEMNLGHVSVSPDGRSIAYTRTGTDRGEEDLWLYDSRRSLRTRLTNSPGEDDGAVWSPDGKQIAFHSERNGPYGVFVQQVNGSAPTETIWKDPADLVVVDWSRDGGRLLVTVNGPNSRGDLWIYDLRSHRGTAAIATEAAEWAGRFSPDGKWIAFLSDRSGRTEVYAQNIATGENVQISTDGGSDIRWKDHGIYYVSQDDRILLARLRHAGASIEPSAPVEVLPAIANANAYDVAPDGSRFLVARSKGEPRQELNVLVGWKSRLQKR